MAKSVGSLLGRVRGKVGDIVFSSWRGLTIIKSYSRVIKHPSKLSYLSLARSGRVSFSSVSVSGVNVHFLFGFLSRLSTLVRRSLIEPVWSIYCPRYQTARNFFVGYNFRYLYDSVPAVDSFISSSNMPDLSRLKVSYGHGECVEELHTELLGDRIKLVWDPKCYSTGLESDLAFSFFLYWKPSNVRGWRYNNYNNVFGLLKCLGGVDSAIGRRGAGESYINLPTDVLDVGIRAEYGFVYLFFYTEGMGFSFALCSRLNSSGYRLARRF